MPEITRTEAAKLIGSQKASDILDVAEAQSVVLNTFPTVQMSKKTYTQPMVASLPDAFFVTEGPSGVGPSGYPAGDPRASVAAGTKPTTAMTWTDKSMTAEEIAVIVPIHENVLADSDIDIFAAIRPKISEAFGKRLDLAVLYGTQAPTSWVDADIVGKAVAAGNRVQNQVAAPAVNLDLAEQFNQLFARVEDDGFDVTDVFALSSLKSRFRGLRDADGRPVYVDNYRTDNNTASVYGQPLSYLHRNVANAAVAQAIALDRTQYQVGIREDFQVKLLTEATVNGVNLAERDMVALRFKFRVGFGSFVSPLLGAGVYPAAVLQPNI